MITGAVGLALAAGVTAAALTGAGSSDRTRGLERTGEINPMGSRHRGFRRLNIAVRRLPP